MIVYVVDAFEVVKSKGVIIGYSTEETNKGLDLIQS